MNRRISGLALGAAVAAASIIVSGCGPLPVGPATTRGNGADIGSRASATRHWNDSARELITRNASPEVARIFAYLALAQRNAAILARQRANPDGAIAGASAAVLAFFFPAATPALQAQLDRETAALGGAGSRADFSAGIEIGERAAGDVIAAAKSDRSAAAWSGSLPNTSGAWMSQARPSAPPLYTENIGMRGFFLASNSEFRAPPPPPLPSDAFRREVAAVRKISDNRTTEQLRTAQYWELVTPPNFPGWWNRIALEAAEQHRLSELETADMLALMHMVWLDAFNACADSKYAYWVPRPTQVDPEIRLAIGLPNHPSYPSNHSCTASAAAQILGAKFPDRRGGFLLLAREAAMSRVYGGIHYPMDIEEGLDIGRKVAMKAWAQGLPADRVWLPPSP
jgi:membrane-associated phospholipid phosphatase